MPPASDEDKPSQIGQLAEAPRSLFRLLGPGLISGAADNDPAGIGTYTQVGAQFGYAQLWTALFAAPLLTAVQEACGRIGLVTGKGLAGVIHQQYGRWTLLAAAFLLVVTNTINIGADIGAMTAAAQLLVPLPYLALMTGSVALILVLEIYFSYRTYSQILKFLALAQLTYLVTALIVAEPWGEIVRATFTPHVEWRFDFLLLAVGNIGSTIAPYLFFWEASQEAEEDREHHRAVDHRAVSRKVVRRMRIDNAVGMVGSQLMSWAIMVTSATVLHSRGATNVKSAADAARALEPLVSSFPDAGIVAKLLFAIGLVTAGLLVIPIFSASASYALCEAVGWRAGLNLKLRRAQGFYAVIVASSLVGLVVNFIGINLIKLLVYTSVLNAIAAVPLLFLVAHISTNPRIMGDHAGHRLSKSLLWLAVLMMILVVGSLVLAINFR